MDFKQQLEKDMSVFFNEGEFANTYTIKTANIVADLVVVEDESKLREWKATSGVVLGEKLICIPATAWLEVFDSLPSTGNRMSYRGSWYDVADVTENSGVLDIVLMKGGM